MIARQHCKLRDQTSIALYRYEPAQKAPLGSIVHIHGLHEHAGRFERLWSTVASRGYKVLAFDLRGHGHSEGARGKMPDWNVLCEDIAEVVISQKTFLGESYFVLGHSMGASLTTTCVRTHLLNPKAAILSSPAFRPGDAIPLWARLTAPLMARLIPNLGLPPVYDESELSTIPAEQEKFKKDPLTIKTSTARHFTVLFEAGKANLEKTSEWTLPTYMFYGAKDRLTCPLAMAEFYESMKSTKKERSIDQAARHEVLFDANADRALNAVIDWIDTFK